MKSPAAVAGDFRTLLREDGSVLIPGDVAPDVLRSLIRDLTARIRLDGGHPSPSVHRVLYALHAASEQRERSGSARGSEIGEPGTIEVTSAAMAERMGCSTRHVRSLCSSGRLRARRAGRDWLITIKREEEPVNLTDAISKKMTAQDAPSAERRKELEGYAQLAKENPALFAELPEDERRATAIFAASQLVQDATEQDAGGQE
ncbi:hypothetical protein [Streptosporangium roseum]|uniref:Helix-turn-helix domain-containing protein n=1 Tax=Streptosporangium roseum (strain ATCC 12428 / DSM 43021 / JCM 3005 / KCTC 9067 / NCIMB 10171 / NRRL 2505 / NI 9100) TaxID=479432 RepID=D2AUH6_STRRD|nr:hypothetical protein [Streptosporangium roseum]ACZ84838.1 hypothetical protein Sros_1850 [Streptosporangium roseum DSM 43021]